MKQLVLVKTLLPFIILLGLIVAMDYAVGSLLRAPRLSQKIIDIQTPDQLAAKLDFLRHYNGYKVVLLGDSLIYGQTMEERGDSQWREHTLSAVLEKNLRSRQPGKDILVLNLGINGALPSDLNALAQLVIPCGIDLLIADIHLRPFSDDFANPDSQFGRPWLRDFAINRQGDVHLGKGMASFCSAILLNHWDLYRFRGIVQANIFQSGFMQWGKRARATMAGGNKTNSDDFGDTILLMKLKKRLSTANLQDTNPQRKSFEEMLKYLEKGNQNTIFFYARENPDQLSRVMPDSAYKNLKNQILSIIRSYSRPNLRFVDSAPDLEPANYLDFLHVNAKGYEILASHLLKKIDPFSEPRLAVK